MRSYITIIIVFMLLVNCNQDQKQDKNMSVLESKIWSKEQIKKWYKEQPFLVGGNYVPISSINQLEMWQEETFDPERIDFELKKASEVGMNTMRVFLHDLLWKYDKTGFFKRIDKFLEISDNNNIKIMFVLFDGVWNPYPKIGKQPEPKPGVHNSGWIQSPGREILEDPKKQDDLKGYVQDVVLRYKDDPRVIIWDLFNEPDQAKVGNFWKKGSKEPEMSEEKKKATALELLKKTFNWVRKISPTQPLTVGVWGESTWLENPDSIQNFSLNNSDIISFHSYSGLEKTSKILEGLKKYNRPLLCTEYLARGHNSTFQDILPLFHKNNVGAYHWGLFNGKSQTIYPWKSWNKSFSEEPKQWHHDVFRKDGTPYDINEVHLIKKITFSNSKANQQ